eukprot:TRINITY_DN6540_c0_g3_i2.p2 TRINITY_DN6540_c0_g3~~TRINITY_DN6540_c0_g3_i2.p2  ORF type:complete len:119 (-),score=11.56 TRINITY_DN6540_c0_g3_i2:717-1073(-)
MPLLSTEQVDALKQSHPLVAKRVALWEDPPQLWSSNCRAVAAFAKEFGRLPNRYSKDSKEKYLGSWLNNQAQKVRAESIPQSQLDELHDSHELVADRVKRWLLRYSSLPLKKQLTADV